MLTHAQPWNVKKWDRIKTNIMLLHLHQCRIIQRVQYTMVQAIYPVSGDGRAQAKTQKYKNRFLWKQLTIQSKSAIQSIKCSKKATSKLGIYNIYVYSLAAVYWWSLKVIWQCIWGSVQCPQSHYHCNGILTVKIFYVWRKTENPLYSKCGCS